MEKIKTGILQAFIVLIPTYLVAYLTDKMVYTIPMLAASSFIAASFSSSNNKLRVDEDGQDGQDGNGN